MIHKKQILKYFYLLEIIEISSKFTKMYRKSAKIIDSNLRNVTKVLHVPNATCAQNVSFHPKCVFASSDCKNL